MSSSCPHCGGGQIEKDDARGDSVCTNCGVVLEENAIVSDVQFAEAGGGAHTVIGQFVHAGSSAKLTIGSLRSGKSSREITLQAGRHKIEEVASQLRLSSSIVDMAFNFLSMAVNLGITKGRRSTHVVAACLYMSCRIEHSPYLLLDFSDVLQVNVYELGRTMDFLAQKLHIRMPITDPCYFVSRFAHRLQFGDKTEDVAKIAMRLIIRMKRDWLAEGRRPAGVCGAALIVAARYYNFNRTIKDVVRVVHVGDQAVKKRLLEFASTPSGKLTVDEFVNLQVDLETEEDPPAFKESKRKTMQKAIEDENRIADALAMQLGNVEKQVEQALTDKAPKRKGPYASYMKGPPVNVESVSPSRRIVQLTQEESFTNDPECDEFVTREILKEVLDPSIDGSPAPTTSALSAADRAKLYGPTLESLGIRRATPHISTSDDQQASTSNAVENSDELDLNGISDSEIDGYILSEPEVRLKTAIWMTVNGAALREIEERRSIKAEIEERERNDPQRKRKPIKRKREQPIQASTAAEAMEKVVQEKRLSAKINYDALKKLCTDEPAALPPDTPKTNTSAGGNSSESKVVNNKMMPSDALKNAMTRRPMQRFKPTVRKTEPTNTTTPAEASKPTIPVEVSSSSAVQTSIPEVTLSTTPAKPTLKRRLVRPTVNLRAAGKKSS